MEANVSHTLNIGNIPLGKLSRVQTRLMRLMYTFNCGNIQRGSFWYKDLALIANHNIDVGKQAIDGNGNG